MATLKQRKEFWETLKSFDGKNVAEEVKTISAMVNKYHLQNCVDIGQ